MARKSAQTIGRGVYLRSYGRAAPFPIPVRSLYYLCSHRFDIRNIISHVTIYHTFAHSMHIRIYVNKLQGKYFQQVI